MARPRTVRPFLRGRVPRSLFLAAIMAGCGPKIPRMLTCDEYYQRGIHALQGKKWQTAQQDFETVTLNFPGCELVDDAQYMLGETYFEQDKFIEAQFEFKRLVEDFRLSDRMEDAQYMMARCSAKQALPAGLDQSGTQEAILRYQQYLDDFPRGRWADEARQGIIESRKKLAQAKYSTARFYYRQGYDDAALTYLDDLISTYPDGGEWLERARFLKATILAKRGQHQEALALLRAINLDSVRPRLRQEVEGAITRLQGR